MYKAHYYDSEGTEAGDRELPIWLFDGIVHEHVLHQAVRAYQLNQRQGSASAKTRSEMRGGGRKPWRQKGTGRARHGTIRSPLWAGGGVVFPPKPKDWRVDLPKKVKRLARRSAWNARAGDGRVLVVEDLDFDGPKTKRLRELLIALEAFDGKVLLLTHGVKETIYLSGRNLPRVQVKPFGDESPYDVLWASTIVVESSALEAATEAAEAGGGTERAEERIARTVARLELEGEDAPPVRVAPELVEAAGADVPESALAAPAGAEQEVAPEAGPEPEEEEEAEPEADDEEEEESAAGAPDVEDVELPTVAELADFLSGIDDVERVRALQERDERKTAQRHYEKRIDELTGEEDDDA